MYAIRWKRENHPLLPDTSGLVLNNLDVNKLNKVNTYDTEAQAERAIKELTKVASSSISFEVVLYKEN